MDSDPRDYIGAGLHYAYSGLDGPFVAQTNQDGGVSIAFHTTNFSHSWRLDFAAPGKLPLAAGVYPGATRYPFQAATEPGLSIAGDSRECDTLTGSFEIREITYGTGNNIESFRAIFEQHCGGVVSALSGEVRYNEKVDVSVRAPRQKAVEKTDRLAFEVSGSDSAQTHVKLTATGLPEGATFVDRGDSSGTFNWVPGFGQIGTYAVVFSADNGVGGTDQSTTTIAVTGVTSLYMVSDPGDYIGGGRQYFFTPVDGDFFTRQNVHQGASLIFFSPHHNWFLDFAAPADALLAVGRYEGATRYPFQDSSRPGLDVGGDGAGCNQSVGLFDIKQVVYKPGGGIDALWATFEQHCESAVPALRGELRINADVPLLVRAPTDISATAGRAVEFTVAGYSRRGDVTLSASGLPPGATFVDNGDGTGILRWLPAANQVGRYDVTFLADDGQGTVDHATSRIVAVVANDTFENATVISELPFTDNIPFLVAKEEGDDPPCVIGETVWYAYTAPQAGPLDVSNSGSAYTTYFGVYTGYRGALVEVACAFGLTRFQAAAGQTYYVVLGSWEGARVVFSASSGSCDDGNACTTDSGDPRTGCIHIDNDVPCSDANACTTDDACSNGLCLGGAPLNCDDGDPCTANSCDALVGCVTTPVNLDATDFSSARIDGRDLIVVADAWNSCPGDSRYNATANTDGISTLPGACIDMTDFHLFMMAFGQSCP
jgi:hypothetical protein